jgi:hypothetical protein
MPPVARGELWPLFHREESLVCVGTTFNARYRACTAELSLAIETVLREQLESDETAVSAGRAAADLHSLAPGRDRNSYGYVLISCRISPDAKTKAEAYYFSKNAIGVSTPLPASAAHSANGLLDIYSQQLDRDQVDTPELCSNMDII